MTEPSVKYIALVNASENGSASPTLPQSRGSLRSKGSHGPRLSLLIRKSTFHTSYMLLVGKRLRKLAQRTEAVQDLVEWHSRVAFVKSISLAA